MVGQGYSERTAEPAEIYEAFRAGQPSPLPELPVQYPDYAIWQREHIQGVGRD